MGIGDWGLGIGDWGLGIYIKTIISFYKTQYYIYFSFKKTKPLILVFKSTSIL